jgi:hypothetical protein
MSDCNPDVQNAFDAFDAFGNKFLNDYPFPEPKKTSNTIRLDDINSDGVQVEIPKYLQNKGNRCKVKKIIPDGIVIDAFAYNNLISKLQKVEEQKSLVSKDKENEKLNEIAENLRKFIKKVCDDPDNNIDLDDLYYKNNLNLLENKFKKYLDSWKRKGLKLESDRNNLKLLHLMDINKYENIIAETTAKIKENAELRGKIPDFSQNEKILHNKANIEQTRRDMELCLNKFDEKIKKHNSKKPQYENFELFIKAFLEYKKNFNEYTSKIEKLNNKADKIKHLILMEKWRNAYRNYAKINKLEVSHNNDEIFEICNLHRAKKLPPLKVIQCDAGCECVCDESYVIKYGCKCPEGHSDYCIENCELNYTAIKNCIGFILVENFEDNDDFVIIQSEQY